MDQTATERLEALLSRLSNGALVIDGDTHITDVARLEGARREAYGSTPDYYHGRPISAEDLLAEMDMAGVDMALTWQNPAATAYTSDPDRNAEALLEANRYVAASATRYPDRILPGGWIDPRAAGLANALALVESCVWQFGFPFVKLNPAQNRFPIDSPEVMAVMDRIVALGAIPAFHFGADTPFTPAEGLARVAERHPESPVLAIHMGGGGASYDGAENLYRQARRLGLEHPNLWFVLSAKRDTHMESDLIAYQLAGEPSRRRLCCGSDAPYGRVCWNFGGFRAMFASLMDPRHPDPRVQAHPGLFTPEAAAGYLGGNMAALAAAGCRNVLMRSPGSRICI